MEVPRVILELGKTENFNQALHELGFCPGEVACTTVYKPISIRETSRDTHSTAVTDYMAY